MHFYWPSIRPVASLNRLRFWPGPKGTSALFDERAVRVTRLVMPESYANGGFIYPDDIAYMCYVLLVAAVGTHSRTKAGGGHDKIYVSGRRRPKRALVGDKLIEDALSTLCFSITYAESLSLRDQINTFANARTVGAPHCAGLFDLIWTNGHCRVLEFFRPNHVNDCFTNLSLARGYSYVSELCDAYERRVDKSLLHEIVRKFDSPAAVIQAQAAI